MDEHHTPRAPDEGESRADDDALVCAFVAFCDSVGIERSGAIAPSHSPGQERSIVAHLPVARDATLLTVPQASALFGFRDLLRGPHEEALAPLLGVLSHAEALALNLALHAGGAASPLQPWFATWPSGEQGSAGMSIAQLEALGWCAELIELHGQREAACAAAHARVAAVLPASACPSLERYRWALSHVGARAVDVSVSGEFQPAILPMIDLCNHSCRPNAALSFDEGAFRLRATRAVCEGEQVCISYGNKSNAELLFGYGFALRSNPSDSLRLRIPLPDDDGLARRLAMAPRGSVAQDGKALWALLRWDADNQVHISQELLLVLAVASAGSTGELFASVATASAGMLSAAAKAALTAAAGDALAALPPASGGEALEARRALLRAAQER